MGSRKGAPNADLAEVAIYAAGRAFDISNAELARRLNRDDQTTKAWLVTHAAFIAKVEIMVRRFVMEQRDEIEQIAAAEYNTKMESLLSKTAKAREKALDKADTDGPVDLDALKLANQVATAVENRVLGAPTQKVEHGGGLNSTTTIKASPALVRLIENLHARKGLPPIIDVTPVRKSLPEPEGAQS